MSAKESVKNIYIQNKHIMVALHRPEKAKNVADFVALYPNDTPKHPYFHKQRYHYYYSTSLHNILIPSNRARLVGSPSSEVTDRDWRTFMFDSL